MSGFKDKHDGEKLFIIGNGPSLNDTPLEDLSNEYTLAMNQINLIYDKTDWRPDYYVFTNTSTDKNLGASEHRLENARETIDSGITSFVLADGKRHFGEKSNITYIQKQINKDRQSAVAKEGEQLEDVWSENPIKKAYSIGSTLYTATQIGVYMGFDEIYYVGCDLWEPRSFRLFYKGKSVDDFEFNSHTFSGRLCEYLSESILEPEYFFHSISNAIYFKIMEFIPNNITGDPNHFSDDYLPMLTPSEKNNKKYNKIHRVIRSASKQYNFEVYNATVGGHLEVHERVDIEDLLESSD